MEKAGYDQFDQILSDESDGYGSFTGLRVDSV
jgi:hypothetical protein